MAASGKKKQVFDTGKDRDVITARPGAKAMGHKCGNPECYVRAIEVPLKACGKCKTIRSVAFGFTEIGSHSDQLGPRYCSRECQTAHWKVRNGHTGLLTVPH